ncbi:MAG TPA: PGPGW domain-containing protein [Microthrixaceae bacterium]|nr:PGPGW domain-containing protein [Microthrixaceae bacterium]
MAEPTDLTGTSPELSITEPTGAPSTPAVEARAESSDVVMPADAPTGRGDAIATELTAAVYEAERETGVREDTEAEVRRSLGMRALRAVAGFVVIGIGVSLIVLPGPGWIVIIIGLSLLPFAWAERTIRLIRSKVPGVPEDGTIPLRTWIVIGVITVGAVVGSFLFGEMIGDAISGAWETVFG